MGPSQLPSQAATLSRFIPRRASGGARFLPLAPTTRARDALAESGFDRADTVQRFLMFDQENPNSIVACLRMARENDDFERMYRICLPLQEARRHIRQFAEDAGFRTVVASGADVPSPLTPGCYLVQPPLIGLDGRALRELSRASGTPDPSSVATALRPSAMSSALTRGRGRAVAGCGATSNANAPRSAIEAAAASRVAASTTPVSTVPSRRTALNAKRIGWLTA